MSLYYSDDSETCGEDVYCPWCQSRYDYTNYLNRESGKDNCRQCGKPFTFEIEYTGAYTTRKARKEDSHA